MQIPILIQNLCHPVQGILNNKVCYNIMKKSEV